MDVENLIACSLANMDYLHTSEHVDMLKSDGMQHVRKEMKSTYWNMNFLKSTNNLKPSILLI